MSADNPVQNPTPLDCYLDEFRRDWVKAGPPSPLVTVDLVRELDRLREALERIAKGVHNGPRCHAIARTSLGDTRDV